MRAFVLALFVGAASLAAAVDVSGLEASDVRPANNDSSKIRKFDVSSLGVDNVTQFTGYLDDEQQDKHLFYCRLLLLGVVHGCCSG